MTNFFTPIVDYFLRIKRNHLRQMMRGYRNLKAAGRLGLIAAVKQDLTTHILNINQKHFSATLMGAGLFAGELIVRQYLLVHVGSINLNRALLVSASKSNAKVVYAMPSEWFGVVEKHGFQVDRLRSTVLWGLYNCLFFIYGVIKVGKVASTFFKIKDTHCQYVEPHAYFVDLAPNNLPSSDDEGIQRNITCWYAQWDGKSSDVAAIHHSVTGSNIKSIGGFKITYQTGILPDLSSAGELARYILWAGMAFLISAGDLLRGRWWHALLLNQAATAAQSRMVPSGLLAKEYFFHSENWIYRPLWTYEAEQIGALIFYYSYSTNHHSFNNINKCMPPGYGWKASNWPYYLAWDQYQENFLREATNNQCKILIVGEIWFSEEISDKINIASAKTVAVFDVQPFRDSKYQSLALEYDYYVPEGSIQFLADILDVLKEFGITMAYKRKREIGKFSHPRYRSYVKIIETKSNVINIPASVSASRLIENSLAVISMPYTSTALLGVNQGKPSIYYDSCHKVVRGDCAAHGIQVLIGKEELRCWIRNIVLKADLAQLKRNGPTLLEMI